LSNREDVLAAVDETRIVDLARKVIQIPSPTHEEGRLADFFHSYMKDMGMEVEFQNVGKSKQVIGKLRGDGTGRSLMFCGHMDHNVVEENDKHWTQPPYGGVIKDGWLYGVASVNMKGPDSSMLQAIDTIRRSNVKLKGDLIFAAVCGEMVGGLGVSALIENGIKSDAAIVGEPTQLQVITKHAGVVKLRLSTKGMTWHYCFRYLRPPPPKGVDALRKMIKIVNAMGPAMMPVKAGSWLKFKRKPGWEELPQFNVSSLDSGIGSTCDKRLVSLMPDFATIRMDFRTLPGMDEYTIKRDLEGLVRKLKKKDRDINAVVEIMGPPEYYNRPVFDASPKSRIVKAVAESHETVRGFAPEFNPSKFYFKVGGSDASQLLKAGIETVVYGPGGEYVMTTDERIRVSDLVDATKIYALTAAKMCT